MELIYDLLLSRYGPQGWWPVTPKGGSEPICGVPNHSEQQKLEIIISSVLTQNTQWKPNVVNALIKLNRRGLNDIDKILEAPYGELAQAIRSAGYFNQKARKLKNVAAFLKEHPIKELELMDQWQVRELLLSVNGIGPETADSILLYALNKPIFVVDAYTKRIFSRIGVIDKSSYETIQEVVHKRLDGSLFNEFHALLVNHAKEHCKKVPCCSGCPLSKMCEKNNI